MKTSVGLLWLLTIATSSPLIEYAQNSESGPLCIVNLDFTHERHNQNFIANAVKLYKTGFNVAYVPIQRTKDATPRLVVGSDPLISSHTMLELTQKSLASGQTVLLLGEFLGSTADTNQYILLMIQDPEDVDKIVHEVSQTNRETSSVVLVVPSKLAEIKSDNSDGISRFRNLVPDGHIIVYLEEYKKNIDHTKKALSFAQNLDVKMIGIPASEIDSNLISLAKLKGIHIGAFGADSHKTLKDVLKSGISFVITRNPRSYLAIKAGEDNVAIPKSHAVIMIG